MNDDYRASIAIGWAASQALPRAIYPAVPLHKGREYHNAASHGDPDAFRARQKARAVLANAAATTGDKP